jgi:hypothetical protein
MWNKDVVIYYRAVNVDSQKLVVAIRLVRTKPSER